MFSVSQSLDVNILINHLNTRNIDENAGRVSSYPGHERGAWCDKRSDENSVRIYWKN